MKNTPLIYACYYGRVHNVELLLNQNKTDMSKLLIVFALFIALVHAEQLVPLSKNSYGITFGPADASLHLEVFYDLNCPYCKAQDALLEEIFSENDIKGLRITYHQFPLPLHRNAFILAKATRVIGALLGDKEAIRFAQYIFKNQDKFSNANTYKLSNEQVEQLIALQARTLFGNKVSDSEISNGLRDDNIERTTRLDYKYGLSRGVNGTPKNHANGVPIDGSGDYKKEQWIKLFSEYAIVTPKKQKI